MPWERRHPGSAGDHTGMSCNDQCGIMDEHKMDGYFTAQELIDILGEAI